MSSPDPHHHLSQISTLWTVVCDAHNGSDEGRQSARQAILDRYSGAIFRYLRKALGSTEAAEELYQEWALRFLSGRMKNAHPERGRFRDYLKTVLYHLIIDYRTAQRKQSQRELPIEFEPAVELPSLSASDAAFLESWRENLLARSWKSLEEIEQSTGQPVSTTLRLRVENARMRSPEMAEELSRRLGKAINANAARQMLYRAREKFAELLLDEVAQSLNQPTRADLEQELIDLNLLRYVKGDER
jgi:RNA polymerase sigma-70 factor (ECF subfamily)